MPNKHSKDKKSVGAYLHESLIDNVTKKCKDLQIEKSELIECIFLAILENNYNYQCKSGKTIEISITVK